jgi:gamma-glutamylcyclotransferase (GGCT)/AIG2-like uncharacterized protein YtfP
MNTYFAHGLFRKGRTNHKLLSACVCLGEGATEQAYVLFIMNRKPCLGKREVSPIKGEVYLVPDEVLALIDRMEGHPRINKRELVKVKLTDGSTVEAWAYFHMQPLHNETLIDSGDYTA